MKKWFSALLAILLLVICFAAVPTRADFGDFSGDSDYGGSDYSSDWGGSSSWDDDDDYYYYGGSSYYGHDESGGDGSWFITIIVVALIVIFVMSKKNGKGGAKITHTPVNAGGALTGGLRPMSEYTSLDPAFDQQAFTEKLSNLYVKMQNAWTDKDIEPLRPYFTDAIFAQMERQLNAYKVKGYTNYVERIAVLSVTPRGFMQSGGEDHIYVELQARIVDYTLEDATGNLISGDKTREKFMTYEWDVSRVSGQITQAETGEEQKSICPSCGAPLDINASARCPYCGTVITRQQQNWALCAIKGISQRTN